MRQSCVLCRVNHSRLENSFTSVAKCLKLVFLCLLLYTFYNNFIIIFFVYIYRLPLAPKLIPQCSHISHKPTEMILTSGHTCAMVRYMYMYMCWAQPTELPW